MTFRVKCSIMVHTYSDIRSESPLKTQEKGDLSLRGKSVSKQEGSAKLSANVTESSSVFTPNPALAAAPVQNERYNYRDQADFDCRVTKRYQNACDIARLLSLHGNDGANLSLNAGNSEAFCFDASIVLAKLICLQQRVEGQAADQRYPLSSAEQNLLCLVIDGEPRFITGSERWIPSRAQELMMRMQALRVLLDVRVGDRELVNRWTAAVVQRMQTLSGAERMLWWKRLREFDTELREQSQLAAWANRYFQQLWHEQLDPLVQPLLAAGASA